MNEAEQWRELLHKKDLEIEAPHRQIDWLTQQLRRLNGRVYGCSSEKTVEPQEQRCCPQCGGELHACGHSVLRRELTYIPAQYKLTEHIQTAYSCRQCEKEEAGVPMKKSTVPPALLPGSGIVSASLLAQIMNSKAEEPAQRAAQPLSGADRTGFLQQTVCAGDRVFAASAFGGTAICAAAAEVRANCRGIFSVGANGI